MEETMKTLKEYWNESFQRPGLEPLYDNWLQKYTNYLADYNELIIDLGCGIGNNSRYLFERGLQPIACDISEEALMKLKGFIPNINTRCFDMSDGLPFESETVKIIIADLSLHYFDEHTTRSIINDIHRVLKDDGVLLCRLNSVNEIINIGETKETQEVYLMESEGIYRRFFDQSQINRFFSNVMWDCIHNEEYEITRYTNKKVLWEIAMKPRRAV
ncbi:class I SAM-dependent methyltransferase [Paenibacillus solani]|uniref:class I SAM-dependent methyltransferase n=1 Tax=Paenibacillus solani TaxID=1705565 RepID=UPI003D2C2162